jgi:broad specificity phosphatase PhoE
VTNPPGERQGLLVHEIFVNTLDFRESYSSDTKRAVETAFFFAVASSVEMTNALTAVLAAISDDK